ncbi:hypothetical protein KJ853_00655 [Patescibacteria group bacterium]|nr:hypothetical protein [Patescibacteria group bacterium]
MVKINEMAVIFWMCLVVALGIAGFVAVRIWVPFVPAIGFNVADKYLWTILAINLLFICALSALLVPFRDPGKIRPFAELKEVKYFELVRFPDFNLVELAEVLVDAKGEKKKGRSIIVNKFPSILLSLKPGTEFLLKQGIINGPISLSEPKVESKVEPKV